MKKNLFDPFVISKLISKALSDDLSDDEEMQFEEWLQASEQNRKIFDSYKDDDRLQNDLHFYNSVQMNVAWDNIKGKIHSSTGNSGIVKRKNTFNDWVSKSKVIRIAAMLLFIGLAAFLTFQSNNDPGIIKDVSGQYKNDVLPGGNQATLILSDGKMVDLKDELNYVANTKAPKNQDQNEHNTLLVPKGGTFQITLPDGTKAWLNSKSEIRFPVVFKGSSRKVYLKGEAYFEVAKDLNKPFIVEVNGSTVEVLGTHFNVNSYQGEIKTTLLEGSVKLVSNKVSKILKPGELGSIKNNKIAVEKADLRKMMAWKNGEFYFKGDRFSDIINQVALWYDLDISIEKGMEDLIITGSIDKDVKLSEILSMLKFITNADFELDGRELTITQ